MAINAFKNTRLPVIGKIRLGIRKETANGVEYPESVEHFVLHDAEELIKVYGDKPTELDAFFLTDNLEEAIPHWLKWYSAGKKDKTGKVIGGDLNCYGTGPDVQEIIDEAGEVTMQEVPGIAHYVKMKDPLTKIIPTRPCKGEKCPDYYDAKGRAQCGPTMKVNIMVPLASMAGIYEIDTKSVVSIGRFVSQLNLLKEQFGFIRNIPFKIYRDPVSLGNPKQPGQKKIHYILSIKVNESFKQEKGQAIANKMAEYSQLGYTGPTEQDSIDRPMEDNYRIENNAAEKVDIAKALLTDPEVMNLFTDLAHAKSPYNEQKQLLTARKFETVADPKASLVGHLKEVLASKQPKPGDVVFQDAGVQALFKKYAELLKRELNPGSVRATIAKYEKEADVKAAVVGYLNTQIAAVEAQAKAATTTTAAGATGVANAAKTGATERMNEIAKGVDEGLKKAEEKLSGAAKPDIETTATKPPPDPNDHGLI